MLDLFLLLLGVCFLAGFVWLLRQRLIYDQRRGAWLREALAIMGDGIIMTDRQGNIRSLNEVATRLTGTVPKAVISKPLGRVLRILDHDTRLPFKAPIDAILSASEATHFLHNGILISAAGREYPVDLSVAPMRSRSGKIRGAVLIFRDISDRYASQQRLRESEERLKAVTDAARIGLVMIDRERRYVYANQFYQQMLGLTNHPIMGRNVAEVLGALYQRVGPNLDRAFAGERLSYEVPGMNKKEQGLNRLYSVTYEPQLQHSLITHVVIVVVDITDMKGDPRTPDPSLARP